MKKFKGFISLLLALVMLTALTPSAALGASATSGTSSDGLSWKISNGTLTISGTGAMTDYGINDNSYPWWSQRKEITKVVVKDGVTHIGFGAFHYCRMTEVVLADSVTSIGDSAFWDCPNLESVDTGGATTIGEDAFHSCKKLESVTFSKDLRSIAHGAFYGCYSLERIDIPAKTRVIDSMAFNGCTSLTTITLPLSITEISRSAFYECDSLSDVYYAGSKSDRNKISIDERNDCLEDAEWHYNSSKAAQPEESDPTAQYYTVSFDACGVTTVASQSVEEYDLASEPNADMTRSDYTFIGWYNGDEKYDFNTPVTANLTLTAKWQDEEVVRRQNNNYIYLYNTNNYQLAFVGHTTPLTAYSTYDTITSTVWNFPTGITGQQANHTSIIQATKAGKYHITALVASGGSTYGWDSANQRPNVQYLVANNTCHWYIMAVDEISKINVDSSVTMTVGEAKPLNYSTVPSGNCAKVMSGFGWSSSDKNVVTISSDGILRATGVGTATISLSTSSTNSVSAKCTVTVTAGSSTQASSGISVTLNGSKLTFDQQPTIIDGRTMVPLRAIFEALGASVDWNSSTQTVTAKKGSTTVKMTIGQKTMYVNNTAKTLDVAPQLVNNRTLVPARAVAESFGCSVTWNDTTKTVVITN